MKKGLILVVDNHPITLTYMSRLLEAEGYEVETASDGLSAIELLSSCVPDVVFLDLVMPNIGGDKLCRIIRAMPKLSRTRVVILSAILADEAVDHIGLGADACIAKGPLDKMGENVLSVLTSLAVRLGPIDRQGAIGGSELHGRAITKELLSTKRHFEAILSSLPEGILELTTDGRIVYANREAMLLLGAQEEELLGESFFRLLGERQRRIAGELFRRTSDGTLKGKRSRQVKLGGRNVSLQMVRGMDEGNRFVLAIINGLAELS